jgi:16S rRNA (adenine1518-N6/adenine1519-N6)-dimethyltransferase
MTVRETLARLGLHPKKSLGQNFMVEGASLAKLADAADLVPTDAVLEIGAGLGALTDFLAARAGRVVAVEIDRRFIPTLRQRYGAYPSVEIVQADILATPVEALLGEDAGHYKVVANLPYYVTSAIVRHLLESPLPPSLLVVTVQAEVAGRIVARPGEMSLLAVGVQFYGQPEVMARLKPGHFYPPPNVESAIVRIAPHPGGPPLAGAARDRFFRVARAGFGQPRKQLRNSLSAGLGLSAQVVVDWLAGAGIDPTRRAETLSINEWLALERAAPETLTPRPPLPVGEGESRSQRQNT